MTLSRVRPPCHPTLLSPKRSGVALVGAIAVVVMVGIFATTIIAFHLATGRRIDQSHRHRQVEHLARAGIEFAIAELLAGREGEFRETYQPIVNADEIHQQISEKLASEDLTPADQSRLEGLLELVLATKDGYRAYRDAIEDGLLPKMYEVEFHVVPDEEQPDLVRISILRATLERENRKDIRVELTRFYRLVRSDEGTLERCEFVSFEYKSSTAESPEAESSEVESPEVESSEVE